MSNSMIAQQRKNKLVSMLNNPQVRDRMGAFFALDRDREAFSSALVTLALQSNLANCSVESIVKSALNIAALKLHISPKLGKAYIVPRGGEACVDIGYKGWLELASRAGLSVRAYPVFKCDHYTFKLVNLEEQIEYEPNDEARRLGDPAWERENLKGVLVVVKNRAVLSDSYSKMVAVGVLNKIMQKSQSYNKGYSPYNDWYLEMMQAKAIKYVVSKTAMTGELAEAVSVDNEADKQNFTRASNMPILPPAPVITPPPAPVKPQPSAPLQSVQNEEVSPRPPVITPEEARDLAAIHEMTGEEAPF